MVAKREKLVLLYLLDLKSSSAVFLVQKRDIILALSKNCPLTLSSLDDIMLLLQKENYLDFVSSDSKNGGAFCVTLKQKALTFRLDLKKKGKEASLLVARTVALAVLSFVVGIVLRAIF